jgi:hypothetical protein
MAVCEPPIAALGDAAGIITFAGEGLVRLRHCRERGLVAELNLTNVVLAQFGAEGSVAIRNSGGASEPAATVWPISTLRETTVPSTGATISV